jgi:hypothetical protein
LRDTPRSRQIALIGLPSLKNARRIFAIVSTTSIPTWGFQESWKPSLPSVRGSLLDADHPPWGVLLACRFTHGLCDRAARPVGGRPCVRPTTGSPKVVLLKPHQRPWQAQAQAAAPGSSPPAAGASTPRGPTGCSSLGGARPRSRHPAASAGPIMPGSHRRTVMGELHAVPRVCPAKPSR